jgi:cobalamin synthase
MVLLFSIIVARLMVLAFSRVFGGLTGDMLGAINEVTEILYLLFCPMLFVVASF